MKARKYSATGGSSRYLFLLPAAAIYISVILVPALYSLYISFFKWNGVAPTKKFVGFQNYINLIVSDPTFHVAVVNNITWIALTLFFTVTIALSFALLINRQFKGRTLFRGVLYFPSILSGIVVALTWTWVYQPQIGLLTSLSQALGFGPLTKAFLADPKTALFAVYAVSLWHSAGAPMILFLAGLQTIPAELIEAARIDGAGKFQAFRHITIPMLSETTVIVIATQIIHSLKVYDIIRAMTGGGPGVSTQTLASYMMTQTFSFKNFGMGAAMAWIMVFVMMFIIVPYVSHMAKD